MKLGDIVKAQWQAHPFQGDTPNRVEVGKQTQVFFDEFRGFQNAVKKAQRFAKKSKIR